MNIIPPLVKQYIEVCPLITAQLSSHTGGYKQVAVNRTSATFLKKTCQVFVSEQEHFLATMVGYIDAKQGQVLEAFLERAKKGTLFVDPILGDHGRFYQGRGMAEKAAYVSLIRQCDIALPNYTEACLLTGIKYKEQRVKEDIIVLMEQLKLLGGEMTSFVMTSALESEQEMVTCVWNGKEHRLSFLTVPKVPFESHGTGDFFAGSLIGEVLKGAPLEMATQNAQQMVVECLRASSQYAYPKREGLLIENYDQLLRRNEKSGIK